MAGTVVLVAEDEPAIADLLELYLARDGYAVHVVRDGAEVVAAVGRLRPAALVMDIGLPNVDGISVCRSLREAGDWTPVLFVTARDDEVDRIVGLEIGADDYIVKPFSPREVVSRVKAVLRRAALAEPEGRVLEAGGVRLDPGRRSVHADGAEVALTATEFDLLAQLMRHRRQVLRREQLLSEVWGYASEVTTRTVDVHVAQVRAKLGEASPIRTVRGVGYVVD
ncbi:MAG: response regulator transcription factor [Sporichthyaceae bacterium]